MDIVPLSGYIGRVTRFSAMSVTETYWLVIDFTGRELREKGEQIA
jgi:hypothetical protein